MQSSRTLHGQDKNYEDRLATLKETVRSDPDNVEACIDLAWLLATCPDAYIRDGRRAVSLARHALELAHDHPNLPETLAAAYAEAGNFELAVHWRTESLDSLPLFDDRV
jgi:cytochrome c-type biogenesis protein CcmH/NrfG